MHEIPASYNAFIYRFLGSFAKLFLHDILYNQILHRKHISAYVHREADISLAAAIRTLTTSLDTLMRAPTTSGGTSSSRASFQLQHHA